MDMMNFYLVSFGIIGVALVIFAVRFEGRKPKAREIVVLAVLIALAVAGRAAFFMVPQFKPMAALVIISGVALGAESGFLVGVMSPFVSNFIFGQGPWTPFQMIAFGIIGLVAGLLFSRNYAKSAALTENGSSDRPGGSPPSEARGSYAADSSDAGNYSAIGELLTSLRAKKQGDWLRVVVLCFYGSVSVMFLYGIVVDVASVLMFSESVNLQSVLAMLASGVPFNILHAIATVIFLLALANPMLQKLERVKQKFGLMSKKGDEKPLKVA